MQERDRKIPSWVFLFLCSCSLFKGGAKNLTVKSILWRGSAYRFLPCPFTVKVKKDQKNWRKRDLHVCNLSEESFGRTWLHVLLAAAEASLST